MPPACDMRWMMKDAVDHAPIWCSVDLRDGNQALVIPMSLEEKLEFYQKLIAIGFKEIEVGFPAASETEYAFLRTLVEKDMIPDDVTVQVLTQAREHIIRRTFEALDGVLFRILTGELHRHRGRLRAGRVQCRPRRMAADGGEESHHQSPLDRAAVHAPCLRHADRLHGPAPQVQRQRHPLPPSTQ